jgi:uncharacterized membrane protein
MPEMILIGWFHTGIAIVALITGYYSLIAFRVIAEDRPAGQIYLICTLITAVTALMIYQHDGFGPGHGLAVLTLLALAGGMLVTRIALFGGLAVYIQTLCYSATLLFHMIPAITDGLLRLPTQNPVLSDPKDPLLGKFYLAFFVAFVVIFVFQVLWLKKQKRS